MADGFARLRSIVEGALDLPIEERAAWIDEACGEDAALRAEALALLEASLSDDTFLDTAPPLERAGRAPVVSPGTRIGSYTIRSTIGVGGMGTVFEAEQDTPRRLVALKVMQAGLLGRGARDRFQYEIEVLGALRHPGIAQIYDAGVHSVEGGLGELPWFAMERIEDARTLVSYARDQALPTAARIERFLDVCDAVQHGHQKGVIHRDLKPDNLLVGASGRVKVIDFGVARVADREALEATLRTQADEIVGTLAYMSPEQVGGGDVDTRSDVYALGVVLYQLLTDELPIQVHKSDFLTSARRIMEEPPRRPRAVAPELRKDLDAILLRCLDKDPRRRYASAGALADDLRRHLAGEAVEARPPSAMHQLKLFARRNKVLVAASTAVFAVAVAAAVVSLQFAFASKRSEQLAQTNAEEARKSERRAEEQAEEARKSEQRAEDTAAEAQEQRDRFQALFESQVAQSVETVSRNAPDLMEVPGGAAIAERMLRETIERLKELERISEGDRKVLVGIMNAYRRVAMAQGSGGNLARDAKRMGMDAIEQSLALSDRLIEQYPDDAELLAQRAATLAFLAESALYTSDLAVAQKYAKQAEAQRAALPKEFQAPEIDSFIDTVLTMIRLREGDHEACHAVASRAATTLEALIVKYPDLPRYPLKLAQVLGMRGDVELKLRRFHDARKTFQASAKAVEHMAEVYPERVAFRCSMIVSTLKEATAVKALGRGAMDQLPAIYERARKLDQRLLQEAPLHLTVRINHAHVLEGLASLRTTAAMRDHARGSPGRLAGLAEALKLYEEGIAVYAEIEREGRLRRTDRERWDYLERVASFYRKAIGAPKGGPNPHDALEPKPAAGKSDDKKAAGEPKKDG